MVYGSVEVPDTSGSMGMRSILGEPGEMDETPMECEEDFDQKMEEYVVCAEVLRRSSRSTRAQGRMNDGTPAITDRHHNEENLEIRDVTGMGSVLFTKTLIQEDDIVCTYNGDCTGQVITNPVEAAQAGRSLYTLVVWDREKRHWIKVDVRDPVTGKSKTFGGNASDGINKDAVQSYWNATFLIDENDPTLIVIKATRPIQPGEMIVVWYGPVYWCNDRHTVELMLMAIKTYGINIHDPEGSLGPWMRSRKYHKLSRLLREIQWTPPPTALTLPVRPYTTMPVPGLSPTESLATRPSEGDVIRMACLTNEESDGESLIVSSTAMEYMTTAVGTSIDEASKYMAMLDSGANVNVAPV